MCTSRSRALTSHALFDYADSNGDALVSYAEAAAYQRDTEGVGQLPVRVWDALLRRTGSPAHGLDRRGFMATYLDPALSWALKTDALYDAGVLCKRLCVM